jgi:ribosomal protein S18 acetylase RimI-like enzyme
VKDILQNPSTASLEAAIEVNILSVLEQIKKWPQATVHNLPEVKWIISDVPSPMINGVMGARLESDQADETIETILAEVKKRNVPIMWWTGPTTKPADLEERLEKHGFVNAGQAPGMAVDLEKIKEDLPTPTGLTVQLVEDQQSLKQWCQVLGAGFEMPDFVTEAYYEAMSHADSEKMPLYLGMMDNQPAAISQLMYGAGVAGIYCVVTLPEARRQGIGAYMTLLPLLEAKGKGYKIGVLHATDMGVSVYRSLGFEEYCKIGHYLWSPEQT